MSVSEESNHRSGAYLLTTDLPLQVVEGLGSLGLKTPAADDPFFHEMLEGLKGDISKVLPGARVKVLDMRELAKNVSGAVHRQRPFLKDAAIVSTCPAISTVVHGHTLEVNRVVGFDGAILGRGPRPGHSSVHEQLVGLRSMIDGQPVILVEDGSFTGETLRYLVDEFRGTRIELAAIVLGFAFPKAREAVSSFFAGDLIVTEEVDGDLIDWMPDHDFFPFVPNCGRVVGVRMGTDGDVFPFYSYGGLSYSIPYLHPFCDMEQWASIPRARAPRFSLSCLHRSIQLFELLNKLNGQRFLISDLVSQRLNVSVPVSVGQRQLPSGDMDVLSFLHEVCHELA